MIWVLDLVSSPMFSLARLCPGADPTLFLFKVILKSSITYPGKLSGKEKK